MGTGSDLDRGVVNEVRQIVRWVAVGLAVLLLAGTAGAQRRGGRGFRGFGGAHTLLHLPEVQRELQMDEAQLDRLRAVNEEMSTRMRATFRELANLPDEERNQRLEALGAEWSRKRLEILDSRQRERLKQLDIQRAGLRALAMKDVQEELKLTADQKQRVQSALDAEREQMFSFFRGGSMQKLPREEIESKLREIRAAAENRLSAVLTDAQRKHFQALQGAPFRFPERRRPSPRPD